MMNAIREIRYAVEDKLVIKLPEFLIGKDVEVIVLRFENNPTQNDFKRPFDPRKFKGAGNLNLSIDEVAEECRKLRNEWERNF